MFALKRKRECTPFSSTQCSLLLYSKLITLVIILYSSCHLQEESNLFSLLCFYYLLNEQSNAFIKCFE